MASPRDHLLLYVDGERLSVSGEDAFSTLSTFLRRRLRRLGTKVVCEEGDCGACTVLVGQPHASGLRYRPIDSCITFLFQLDATHIVTVEGLGTEGAQELHPVQGAMIDGYGSQCGFCTPGFVTALAGLFEEHAETGSPLTEEALRLGLSGNLCRCTGYAQIVDAARTVPLGSNPRIAERFATHRALERELLDASGDPVEIRSDGRRIRVPATVDQATAWRAGDPEAVIVAGATDLGVLANKGRWRPQSVLVLGPKLGSLTGVETKETTLRIGGLATWSEVLDAVREPLPELARLLERFGAPQIRNSGTIAGNLVNASPIADSAPALVALGAELELRSANGARRVPLEQFFRAYKEVDLAADELLARIDVPLPPRDGRLLLYKVSRRRDLDISTVTAAIALRLADGRVRDPRIVFGGVAPVVLRLERPAQLLDGAPLERSTFAAAGRAAAEEITPISDVRGSAAFRRRLAENILLHTYYDLRRAGERAPVAAIA